MRGNKYVAQSLPPLSLSILTLLEDSSLMVKILPRYFGSVQIGFKIILLMPKF